MLTVRPDEKLCLRCREAVPLVCLVAECPHMKIEPKAVSRDFDTADDMDDECPNCNDEGVIYMCQDECACIDPEGGCDLCARACDWCRPVKGEGKQVGE